MTGASCADVQHLAGAVMIFVDSGVGFAVFGYFLCDFVGGDHRDCGVMHYAAVSGKDLGGLHPFVFGEVGGNVDVFVIVLARAGDRELGNRETPCRA